MAVNQMMKSRCYLCLLLLRLLFDFRELSEYSLKRKKRIAENEKKMREILGDVLKVRHIVNTMRYFSVPIVKYLEVGQTRRVIQDRWSYNCNSQITWEGNLLRLHVHKYC